MSVPIEMDLSPAIALLATDILTVTRNTSTFNSSGVAIPGTPTTQTIPGCAQPITGKDLARLPEAQRTHGAIIFFSVLPLQIAATPSALSDRFTWHGDAYRVVHSEQWDGFGGYWRSILVKEVL